MINNFREKNLLILLLEAIPLKPSSYYYTIWVSKQPDKYKEIGPIIHEISERRDITRLMSRKGKSGENAACEGFFGSVKAEMYYG